jgi:hypothetical protein
MLQQAGLGEDVELHAEPGRIIVEAVGRPRAGWREAAAAMHAAGDDELLPPGTRTAFDDEGWEWRRRR